MNQSKENEGKRAGDAIERLKSFIRSEKERCLVEYGDIKDPMVQGVIFAENMTLGIILQKLDELVSGERGEVERLRGLIENIFKANEEMALDITEPRDNIEINWKKFKATHNL